MTTSDGLQWLDGSDLEGHWLIAARNIDPSELLRRAGGIGKEMHLSWAEAEAIEMESDVTILRAGRSGDWSFFLASYGAVVAYGADMDSRIHEISKGTEAVELSQTTNFDTHFIFAVDGQTVCTFDPLTDPTPTGREPGRLIPAMIRVGLLDEHGEPIFIDDTEGLQPVKSTYRMTEEEFGISVPREILTDQALSMAIPR
ncbi:DUF6461 domain-containing protein [Streptomyces goshikiensis]|uniref:DUF6461 domain-containing protein n=1 Tax=Streptomyces goshikiensis TaxID=1942 RepID=UPI00167C1645|nr:DUF6461 domain-containing protein [Streptomyces goshikiensis]GHD75584.1 hypothetical protein GCM10010336_51620 [Streptomyces goshikiensis]